MNDINISVLESIVRNEGKPLPYPANECTCRDDMKQRPLCPVCDKEEYERLRLVEAEAKRPKQPNSPFTQQEETIMSKIVEVNSLFNCLPATYGHPSEGDNWVDAVHDLQNILMYRALKRLYPNYLR